MPALTLADLAKLLGAELRGEETCSITGIASLQSATSSQISFLDNPRYAKYLATTQAAAVILSKQHANDCSCPTLIMENPYLGYAKVASLFEQKPNLPVGIHPTVVVGEGCEIHPSASVGAYCVIGDKVKIGANVVINPGCSIGERCFIGDACHLWSNVVLYHGVNLGQRVILHSGVVVGSDGFGNAQSAQGWHKVPQLGGVIIGNDVEIGANTTVDRGALEDTIIEDGVKLDNQIQIGHNVHIGMYTAIAGCVAIAGSTKIGKRCLIGGGACIAGHLDIADNVVITGMTGIPNSITEPGVYSGGVPPLPNRAWRKNAILFCRLDELNRRVRQLEKMLVENTTQTA
ncbi:UDP-3-O-(3-hydroxymyristoyl)glucosamine N-acyltransferase [soil metagenome]